VLTRQLRQLETQLGDALTTIDSLELHVASSARWMSQHQNGGLMTGNFLSNPTAPHVMIEQGGSGGGAVSKSYVDEALRKMQDQVMRFREVAFSLRFLNLSSCLYSFRPRPSPIHHIAITFISRI
jgi:hypothetical protein